MEQDPKKIVDLAISSVIRGDIAVRYRNQKWQGVLIILGFSALVTDLIFLVDVDVEKPLIDAQKLE